MAKSSSGASFWDREGVAEVVLVIVSKYQFKLEKNDVNIKCCKIIVRYYIRGNWQLGGKII